MDGSELGGDDALALSRISAIKRGLGDPTYSVELRRLLLDYPATPQALTDLKDALASGETFEPVVRGMIYYRNNDYTTAEPAFREQITAAPNATASAEAYYYLAAIQESRGEPPAAARLTTHERRQPTRSQPDRRRRPLVARPHPRRRRQTR